MQRFEIHDFALVFSYIKKKLATFLDTLKILCLIALYSQNILPSITYKVQRILPSVTYSLQTFPKCNG